MSESILRNTEWLLFVGILANQAGVPVPVAPWLLAAGMLIASGHLSLVVVIVGAVGAALGADLAWYGLGRWRGAQALRGALRLLRQTPATVDRVTRVFRAHQLGFLWGARFLPELNPIAAGLAGVARVGLARFLLYGSGSALAWTGVWVGAGFVLAGAIAESPTWLGIPVIVWVAITATAVTVSVAVLAGRRRRHHPAVDSGAATEFPTRLERVWPRRGDRPDRRVRRSTLARPPVRLGDRPGEEATAA
jgi:membrane protein DedA with SNARE-associated domain